MTDTDSFGSSRLASLLALLLVGSVALGFWTTAVAAQDPDRTCVGSGGGTPYVTDTGLTVYENDTDAGVDTFYFPDSRTVRFNFSTDGVNLSAAGGTDAHLENGTGPTTCLGDVNATEYNVTISPDSENNITLSGTYEGLSSRDVNFSDGSELDTASVGADGSATFDGLPTGEYDLNLTASEQDPISYSNLAVSDSTVVEGESFDVSATATNNDESSSQIYTAELKKNGTVITSKSGTLAAGANTVVTFSTSFSTVGSYNVTINDLSNETVSVQEPISYSGLSISDTTVTVGESLDVSATATNNDDASSQSYTAELKKDGAVEDTKSGTLASGADTQITFTTSYTTAGSYNVTIADLSNETVSVSSPTAGIQSAIEANGTIELVANRSAQIEPGSLQIFLDGREIHNASDGFFADPIDGVTTTPTTGSSATRHTIELTAGGSPVDINPSRDLTVAFDLEREVNGLTLTTDVDRDVSLTGAVVRESAGFDSETNAQRIYRGADIAFWADESGNDTALYIDATGQDLSTGTDSRLIAIDSTISQFSTGETVGVEFNNSASNVEYFELRDLGWSVSTTQTTVSDEGLLEIEISAYRGGAPYTAELRNTDGAVVDRRQQTLGGDGTSTLSFDPQQIDGLNIIDSPYTVAATDNRTTNTDSTTEIEVTSGTTAPTFSVDILSVTPSVPEGETISLTAEISNVGSAAGTQTISLADLDGTTVDSQSVSLDAGNTTEIDLEWATQEGDAGSGDITVSTENDTASTQVTVGERSDTGTSLVPWAVEAAGTVELVTNESARIEPDSLQIFLDGTEIHNASDGTFAGPIDDVDTTSPTGDSSTRHTIELLAGGQPVDIDPVQDLTVAFTLNRTAGGTAELTPVTREITLTGDVVRESAGFDSAVNAQRIYRGADIAVWADQSGNDTNLFLDATGQDLSTGQDSRLLTLDSSSSQYSTGETVGVEFNDSSSNVEYFTLRDLGWSVSANQTAIADDEPVEINVSANRGSTPFTAELRNTAGTVVEQRQQTLAGDATSTLSFDPRQIQGFNGSGGPYTVIATDSQTTNAETTDEITVTRQYPNFSVRVDSTTAPVTEGERLQVTTTVENVGTAAGTQRVTLASINGTQVANRTVSLDAGNTSTITLTWSTVVGDAGSGEITVASDNDTATQAVTIDEADTNDPPDAAADRYETATGTTLTVAESNGVLANDTDPDDDSLQASLQTDVSNGTLQLDRNGSFEYTPDTGFTGTDSFTYTASDGNGGTDQATATVSVREEGQPSDFQVTITDVPASVVAGESVAIDYRVENVGEASDTQDVTVSVGDTTQTTAISLDGDQSTSRTATEETASDDVPEIAVTVESENDTATETVTVEESDDGSDDPGNDHDDSGNDPGDDTELSVEKHEDGAIERLDIQVENPADDERFTVDLTAEDAVPTVGSMSVETLAFDAASGSDFALVLAASDVPMETTPAQPTGSDVALGYLHAENGSAVENVSIEFTVDERTLDTQNIPPETVVFQRYNETTETWTKRNTTLLSRADDGRYRTVMDSFSEWALTADRPEVAVTDADLETATIQSGEPIDVTVTVSNTGNYAGKQTIELLADGQTVATEEVTVAGGETEQLTLSTVLDATGTYNLTVGDTDVGPLTIESSSNTTAPTTPADGTDDSDTSESAGDSGGPPWLLIAGAVVVLGGILAVVASRRL